jgi:hypothetical protein
MKTVIRKAFLDYEKEEAWLNEKAASGLALVKYSVWKYTFEDCEKGEYIYRLEYLERSAKNAKEKAYLQSMADAGIELIQNSQGWAYFRKKAADGPFDLFSDLESKIAHYRRIQGVYVALAILELAVLIPYIGPQAAGYALPGVRIGLIILLGTLAGLMGFLAIKYQIRIRRLTKEKQVRK